MIMKTTFDLPENLVQDVKRLARERGTTARAIVQQALMRVVDEQETSEPFLLRDVSVLGWAEFLTNADGLTLTDAIRETYEDTGRG